MSRTYRKALQFLAILLFSEDIHGFTTFADDIVPNARIVVVDGQTVVGLGHENFVVPFSDVSIANPFGVDMFNSANANGFDPQTTWVAVCDLDSDGDGFTNGVELCDPDCVNAGVQVVACVGDAVLTHPGFPPGVVVGFSAPPYLIAHGILMIVAWLFVAPFGILRAVFYKKRPGPPTWFRDHKVALCITIALTWLSFAIMVKNQGTDTIFNAFDLFPGEVRSSATGVHVMVGVFVLIISLLQPLSGYFRAHLPPKGEAKSNVRLLWEFQHQWTGRAGLILGLVCISTGLPFVFLNGKKVANAFITIFVLVGISCFAYVLLFRAKHVAKLKAAAGESDIKSNGLPVAAVIPTPPGTTPFNYNAPVETHLYKKVASMSFRDSFKNVSNQFHETGNLIYGKSVNMMNNLKTQAGLSPSVSKDYPQPQLNRPFEGQQQQKSAQFFQKDGSVESNMFDEGEEEEDEDGDILSSRKSSIMRRSKKISHKDIRKGSDYHNAEVVEMNPRFSRSSRRQNSGSPATWASSKPIPPVAPMAPTFSQPSPTPIHEEEIGFKNGTPEILKPLYIPQKVKPSPPTNNPTPYKQTAEKSSARFVPSATFNTGTQKQTSVSFPAPEKREQKQPNFSKPSQNSETSSKFVPDNVAEGPIVQGNNPVRGRRKNAYSATLNSVKKITKNLIYSKRDKDKNAAPVIVDETKTNFKHLMNYWKENGNGNNNGA